MMHVQAFCLQKWPMVLQFCKCGCFIVFYWSIRLIHYITHILWISIAGFQKQTDSRYGQLIMDMPVLKIWVAPLALGECTMSDFENTQHKLYVLGESDAIHFPAIMHVHILAKKHT